MRNKNLFSFLLEIENSNVLLSRRGVMMENIDYNIPKNLIQFDIV